MATYISILRGINVSGQKSIRMNLLRNMYENLGFRNVRTYVQSGNVVFQSKDFKLGELEEKISGEIERELGFSVLVIVLTLEKFSRIIDHNPLSKDPEKDPTFLHVTFLASKPVEVDAGQIESRKSDREELIFSEEAIYLYCPDGYGKTKLNNGFLESKLKVTATTRNWTTTKELLKMALGIPA